MPKHRTASHSPALRPGADRRRPRETWRKLLNAVDSAFDASERYWYQGRYFVVNRRTSLTLVRDPGNERIEVRVAATGPGRTSSSEPHANRHSEGGAPPLHLQTIHVVSGADIAPALEAVKRAQRRWARYPHR